MVRIYSHKSGKKTDSFRAKALRTNTVLERRQKNLRQKFAVAAAVGEAANPNEDGKLPENLAIQFTVEAALTS